LTAAGLSSAATHRTAASAAATVRAVDPLPQARPSATPVTKATRPMATAALTARSQEGGPGERPQLLRSRGGDLARRAFPITCHRDTRRIA